MDGGNNNTCVLNFANIKQKKSKGHGTNFQKNGTRLFLETF